jgi:imidazolonepropionase-like amidohydrolase
VAFAVQDLGNVTALPGLIDAHAQLRVSNCRSFKTRIGA